MKLLLTSIVLLATSVAHGQESGGPAERLMKVDFYAFGGVGFGGQTSTGEICYREIMAGDSALNDLSRVAREGSIAARLYALHGLARLNWDEYQRLKKHIPADANVEQMIGCESWNSNAASLLPQIEGEAIYARSEIKASFDEHFHVHNPSLDRIDEVGLIWSVSLSLKEEGSHRCLAAVSFPVTRDRKIQPTRSAAEIRQAIGRLLALPFIREQFEKHGAHYVQLILEPGLYPGFLEREGFTDLLAKSGNVQPGAKNLEPWAAVEIAKPEMHELAAIHLKTGELVSPPSKDK